MAKHEFGIMQEPPQPGKRYDAYEPQKYSCISVNDDYIENILDNVRHIDCYWHTLAVKEKGIAYCGITLIPPYSMQVLGKVINHIPELSELKDLVGKAFLENKWIIHFGL